MIGRRISTRIGIALFATLLLFAVLQGLLFRQLVRSEVELVRAHGAEAVVSLARLAAASPDVDEARLEAVLGDDVAIVVYDRDGRPIASGGHVEDGAMPPASLDVATRTAADARGGQPHFLAPLDTDTTLSAVASVPGGRYVGVLEVETGRRIGQLRRRGQVIVFGLTGLVALVMTFVFARRVRRRVKAAESVVRSMAAGDLDVRLPNDEDDELGALARDFNVMADRVQALVVSLRAEEARQKSLFATFTHEIGTPLTSVLGYLEALTMPEVDADEATRKKYVAVAYERARQLDALADDLTTLSRLDWDGLPLDRVAEDLRALAQREADALAPEAKARTVTIRVDGDAAIAEVDPVRMGQVVRNVLTNAIRHAREATDVEVAVRAEGERVAIVVTDRGEGIAPEHLARLGQPLYRPDPSRDRATGGRGLGLAISRGIVRAHGGTLEIRSTVGEGTTVAITLPARTPGEKAPDR